MTGPLLIHAVMRAAEQVELRGPSPVPGASLGYVVEGDLAAIVSILAPGSEEAQFADPEAAATLSVAHHELLTMLSSKVDLAPVRLGAAYETSGSVAALLRDEGETLRKALARISGAQEFAVKLTPLPSSQMVPAEEPPVSGRSFLQRRSDAAARQRQQAEAARHAATSVIDALRVHASAHAFASPRRHATADQEKRLVDVSLLVPRAVSADFTAAVCAAQDRASLAGYRLTVRGPLPAYSFVGEAA